MAAIAAVYEATIRVRIAPDGVVCRASAKHVMVVTPGAPVGGKRGVKYCIFKNKIFADIIIMRI